MPRRRGSSSGLFLTLHTCLTAWCISLLPPAAASVYRLKKFLFPQVPFPIESRHFSLPGPFSSTVVASFWAQAAPLGWQLLFPLSSPLPPHGSGSCPHTCSHTHARLRVVPILPSPRCPCLWVCPSLLSTINFLLRRTWEQSCSSPPLHSSCAETLGKA